MEENQLIKMEKINNLYTVYRYQDKKSEYLESYDGEIIHHNKDEEFKLYSDRNANSGDLNKKVREGTYEIKEIVNLSTKEFGIGKEYRLKRKNLISKL